MSDYLTNLITRAWHPERTIQPRVSSMFDSGSPITMSRGTGGDRAGAVRDEGSDDTGLDPTHDRSVRHVPRATMPDQGTVEAVLQHTDRLRKQTVASTVEGDRLSSSSKMEMKSLDQEEAIGANLVVPDSRNLEERWPRSDEPPAPTSVNVSPGQSSVKATGLKQKGTLPPSTRAGLSEAFAVEGSTDEADGEARGEVLRPNGDRPTEERQASPMMTAFHPQDCESNKSVTARGSQVETSLFQDSDGPTRSGDRDGDLPLQHRQVTGIRRLGGTSPDSHKEMVELDLSEFSLDPSLVTSASVKKTAVESQYKGLEHRSDLPAMSVSAEERQGPLSHTLAVPMTLRRVIAGRRSAVPAKESTVSRESARDRERSAEPVVQVTIGRVEVRAVSAPVRQEKGRKPQSAMSLDDYLKGRSGRSGG